MKNQLTLAEAIRDIGRSIGEMSIKLRERANNMVLEYTQKYRRIQEEVKANSMRELKEAAEMFPEDSETYKMLLSNIIQERSVMFNKAQKFITELSEE